MVSTQINNWLNAEKRLVDRQRISEDERTSQDLDSRTYGNILHRIHHDVMFEALGLKEGRNAH